MKMGVVSGWVTFQGWAWAVQSGGNVGKLDGSGGRMSLPPFEFLITTKRHFAKRKVSANSGVSGVVLLGGARVAEGRRSAATEA